MSDDVSIIHLFDCASGAPIGAELRGEIGKQQLADWETQWRPAIREIQVDLLARKVPMQEWPQSLHWRWDKKVAEMTGLLAYQGFSVVCGGVTQGLMRVDLTKSARIAEQAGKPLVYIELLETAPWNRVDCVPIPRYKGVGSALLAACVSLSQHEGFKGRTALHSLPRADGFYRALGMTDLGPDQHYHGQLRYFEFTTEQAAKFLGA